MWDSSSVILWQSISPSSSSFGLSGAQTSCDGYKTWALAPFPSFPLTPKNHRIIFTPEKCHFTRCWPLRVANGWTNKVFVSPWFHNISRRKYPATEITSNDTAIFHPENLEKTGRQTNTSHRLPKDIFFLGWVIQWYITKDTLPLTFTKPHPIETTLGPVTKATCLLLERPRPSFSPDKMRKWEDGKREKDLTPSYLVKTLHKPSLSRLTKDLTKWE